MGGAERVGEHRGPGRGSVRTAERRRLADGVPARDAGGRPLRAGRPTVDAAAPWARIVNLSAHSTQRQSPILLRTRVQSRLDERVEEPGSLLAPEGILVNTVSPGTVVTASFTEALRGVFDERGLDASTPTT